MRAFDGCTVLPYEFSAKFNRVEAHRFSSAAGEIIIDLLATWPVLPIASHLEIHPPHIMFTPRLPSVQWEPIAPPDLPGCALWAWFFPGHAVGSVTISVPKATFAQFAMELTARRLIAAVGWPIDSVATWTISGTTLDPQGGNNPLVDQPFPPMPGLDLEVSIALHSSQIQRAMGPPPQPAAPVADPPSVVALPREAASAVEQPTEKESTPDPAPDPMAVMGLDEILAAAEPVDAVDEPPSPSQNAPAATAAPTPVAGQPTPPFGGLPGNGPVIPQPMPPGGYMPPQVAAVPMTAAPMAAVPPAVGQPGLPVATAPISSNGPPDPNAERIFASIEADWRAIEQLERQLASVTKQLNSQAAKLQSLNRDLSTHERMAADSNDIKDWNDVRRMLRDGAANISKQVRAFDIGTVSAAGNRNRFQEIFENHVKPKVPFDNMVGVAQEFEAHRKVCQNLLTQSASALSGAQRDAEGRARSTLSRISSKAKARR